jgi:gag-polyprotein putative aspartyl protease
VRSQESRPILAADQRGRVRGSARHRVTGSVFRRLMFFVLLLLPLQALAQPRVVALPFRYVDSFILVDAKIDGTPVRLLVDTGANKTILNAKSFGRVEMHVSKPVNRGAGIVGNALRLRVDLEIAHQFMFSQHVSVMDLEELSRRFGIQFDGLLGQDILNQFHSVRIDYKNHVIELER